MFFENEHLRFNILDVLYLDQGNVNIFNTGRNFDALSLRLSSNAILKHGEREILTKDGAVCFVPSELGYGRSATVDKCIVIHFQLDNPASHNIDMIFPNDGKKVESLFFEILKIWKLKSPGYKYKVSALFYEILAECFIGKSETKTVDERVRAGVEYINSNYKRHDVSVSEAAKRSFMSEVYFRNLFKAELGISPKKYIIKLRIKKAASLINMGYYSLKEIADMCGYTDYKYFSVEFKRFVGVSPSEYEYISPQQNWEQK